MYFVAYLVISFFWAFYVMPFFYDMMPKDLFLAVFFFFSTFVWFVATYIANIATGEETDLEDSAKEGLLRTVVGFALLSLIALTVVFLLSILLEGSVTFW